MFNSFRPTYSGTAGFGVSSFSGASVWLWLYSPKEYDTQVIRPYVYNFTGNMVDKLAYSKDFDQALRNGKLFSDPDFATAIRPEANGVAMNMNSFNSMWTFVLMMDVPAGRNAFGMAGCGAKTRLMASGWCASPPVVEYTMNSATPIVDPNCLLYATHQTSMRIGDAIGNVGSIPQRYLTDDNDLVGSYLNQMTPHQDLFLCTPGDTINNVGDVQMDGGGTPISRVSAEGVASLSALNNEQVPLPTRLKSPRHHLQEITGDLQSAIDTAANSQFATSSEITAPSTLLGQFDPLDQSLTTFKGGLYKAAGAVPINIGIDVSQPFSIGLLQATYGDALTVQPIRIARRSQYDVIPQTEMSAKIVFSSMISSAISTLAIGEGIADIRFSLRATRNSMMRGGNNVVFQVHYDPTHPEQVPVHLICPDPNPAVAANQLETAVMHFKTLLESDIVPVLQNSQGDFELHCRHDMGSETIVDLHFCDYNYSSEAQGFYESSNRLPVTNNPILGTQEVFVHNGTELQTFSSNIASKQLLFDGARPSFNKPVMPSVSGNMFGNTIPVNQGGMNNMFM